MPRLEELFMFERFPRIKSGRVGPKTSVFEHALQDNLKVLHPNPYSSDFVEEKLQTSPHAGLIIYLTILINCQYC